MDRTPQQLNQLKTWSEERDSILGEISTARTELETLHKQVKEASASHTDVNMQLATKSGLLLRLEIEDKERVLTLSQECLDLEKKKTRLETTNNGLAAQIKDRLSQKNDLLADIDRLEKKNDDLFKKNGMLDQVLARVVRVSDENVSFLQEFAENLKGSLTEIGQHFENHLQDALPVVDRLVSAVKNAAESTKKVAKKNKGINQ